MIRALAEPESEAGDGQFVTIWSMMHA